MRLGKISQRQRSVPFPGDLAGATTWEYKRAATGESLKPPIKGVAAGRLDPRFLTGTQVTASETHPEWNTRKGSTQDIGGEFTSQKTYVVCDVADTATHWISEPHSAGQYRTHGNYHGPCLVHVPGALDGPTGFLPFAVSNNNSLRALGTTAIARCKPTNSTADLAVGLGELVRDGLPHLVGSTLWRDKALTARNAGSEYLNAEFGWKPLVNEINGFAEGVVRGGDYLDQYIADAGKVVRRRYEFPPIVTRTDSIFATNARGITAGLSGEGSFEQLAYGTVYKTETVAKRQWFSGAFTYELPGWFNPSSAVDRQRLYAQKILGIELTPNTLWNLAPWTWAADWFSNMGDVVSNMSDWAVDGLSLRWGYLMEHTVSTRRFVFSRNPASQGPLFPSTVSLVSETKRRVRATPFGFGSTWDSLSSRQLAILGALGVTRSSKGTQ